MPSYENDSDGDPPQHQHRPQSPARQIDININFHNVERFHQIISVFQILVGICMAFMICLSVNYRTMFALYLLLRYSESALTRVNPNTRNSDYYIAIGFVKTSIPIIRINLGIALIKFCVTIFFSFF